MTADLSPYVSFRETAREAMEFYQSVFGGELKLYTFAEFNVSADPAEKNKITYAVLTTPSGFVLRATDTPNEEELVKGSEFSICLNGAAADEAELRGYWQKLSVDAKVLVPLDLAPWGETYGMCEDRYGVTWRVNIEAE